MSFAPMTPSAGGLAAARVKDLDNHQVAIDAGSANVWIEGQAAARVSDKLKAPCSGAIREGSATVFINGFAAARKTDPTACGGTIATGAARTFIGDGAGDGETPHGCFAMASQSGAATISFS